MKSFVVPPSPNFGVTVTMAINDAGNTCAYCSRCDIVIMRYTDKESVYDFDNRIISKAHRVFTSGIKFVRYKQNDGKQCEYLCSCGDDGNINVWDIESLKIISKCSLQSVASKKLVGIDVSCNNNDVVSVTERGVIVKYNLAMQKAVFYEVDIKQLNAICIAASPHKEDLIAIGATNGLIVVYSLKDNGKLMHKLRPHENDVLSVSWCPVPYNVFQAEKLEYPDVDVEDVKDIDESLLLASCSRDNAIYICKAGTNGYCEAFFNLPSKPLTYIPNYTSLISTSNDRIHCISWVEPTTFVVSTYFGELLSVSLRRTEQSARSEEEEEDKDSVDQWNFQLLHKRHRRCITTVAVPYYRLGNNFPIWTVSADRTICRYFSKSKKSILIPTLNGLIYGLSFSTANPDLLAIGSSDSKIYLWNTGDEICLDIKVLSKKIKDKVLTVSWNPISEGALAFATSEGRVGLCDISQGFSNTKLMKPCHSKPIYRLCWIPFSYDLKEQEKAETSTALRNYRLLAVGGGIIVQYNPWSENASPIVLKEVSTCDGDYVTELAYHSPDSVVAIGFVDGNVRICDAKSMAQVKSVIKVQNKSILSMMWHPQFLFTTSGVDKPSSCKDWLAIAAEGVVVYRIDTCGDQPPKKVAYHDIHKEKVNEICWSPHYDGRLLSVSGDHCVVVWDALSQTILGYYINHTGDVLCGVWHPINSDLVITAGQDACRVWSLNSDVVGNLGAKDQKKKQKYKHKCDLLVVPEPCHVIRKSSATVSRYDKKQKKLRLNVFLMPSFGSQFESLPYLEDAIDEKLSNLEIDQLCSNETTSIVNGHNDVNKGQANGVEDVDDTEDETIPAFKGPSLSYLNIFRNEEMLDALICHEEKVLDSVGSANSLVLTQVRGKLQEKVTEAMRKNQVTESMIALAPSISLDFWKDACEVYVEQMIREENMTPALNILLATNQQQRAVNLLCEKNFFKEAFLIARNCLKEQVKDITLKWIRHSMEHGNYRVAAQCYLYLEDYAMAARVLMYSSNPKDKYSAAKLMCRFDENKGIALVADCFRHFIAYSAWSDIQSLLQLSPSLKYLNLWSDIAHLQTKKIKPDMVIRWLEGKGIETESFEELKVLHYEDISEESYDKLLSIVPTDSFNMDIGQLVTRVSGQMALAIASGKKECDDEARLKHLVKAVDFAYSYRILNANSKHDEFAPLLNVLMMMFPKGPTNTNMLIDNSCVEENVQTLLKSLRAYLGECVVLWLVSLKVNDDEKTSEDSSTSAMNQNKDSEFNLYSKIEKLKILLTIFLDDILDTDTALYYKNKSKLKILETRGPEASYTKNHNVEDSEQSISADTQSVQEEIRNFEQQRVSSPNPFYFGCVLKPFLMETNKTPFQDDADVLLQLLLGKESECDMWPSPSI